mgnify:FL=1
MKKLIILFLTLSNLSFGQDIHFSQYQENPLLVNPANAGLNKDLRAIINYRNQWKSVGAPFQTMAMSFDMITSKDPSKFAAIGVGFNLFNDKAGDANLSHTQGNLSISSILRLDNKNKLSVGIQAGFGQRGVDYSALRWGNQYDGSYNSTISSNETLFEPNYSFMDAGAGIAWSYGQGSTYMTSNNGIKANVGVSYFHFGLPNAAFSSVNSEKLHSRMTFHANMEFGKPNTNLTLIPSVLVNLQNKQLEAIIGSDFRYLLQEGSKQTGFVQEVAITIGAHYRYADALIAKLMFEYSNYSVGFSYDVNVSKLSAASNFLGGFELALKFVTPSPFKNKMGTSKFR